jgi:hypothetical protein
MVGRILALGLLGWSGIIALAWWLADQRIALCGYGEHSCVVRATGTRDFVLVSGLTVTLVVTIAAALLWARRGRPFSFNWSKKPGDRASLDASSTSNSLGKGSVLALKASLLLVLGLIALLSEGLYQKPDPKSARVVLTPVEGNPFADLIPTETKEETAQAKENHASAAEESEDLTNANAETDE